MSAKDGDHSPFCRCGHRQSIHTGPMQYEFSADGGRGKEAGLLCAAKIPDYTCSCQGFIEAGWKGKLGEIPQ